MTAESAATDPRSPRWWPTRGLVAALALVSRAPYSVRLALGAALGRIMMGTMRRRRQIARANLVHCYPRWSEPRRAAVLRDHFRELGIALLETGASWTLPGRRLDPLLRIRGLENIGAALRHGRGALLVTAHLTCLEMAMQLIARRQQAHAIYRRNIHWGRSRHGTKLFDREDMRTLLRALRDNRLVWFSPDQDHGLSQGAFVEFFGQPAATVTTTARLAARTGAAVLPLVYRRLPGRAGYELEVLPALEDFPGDDLEAATRRLNRVIEHQVHLAPEQYLWVHRRFKTRPPGCAPIYPS